MTIVIPVYNSMAYIEECLKSALNQDYLDYEILAYDNESTDGSYEWLIEQESQHEILHVKQLPNIHPNSYREAFDKSFQEAQGGYLTFLSSDDFFAPDYISNCMKIIAHAPDQIKCLQSGIVGVNGGQIVDSQIHFYKNMSEFKAQCMTRSPVNTPTVVYRVDLYPLIQEAREAHEHYGLLDCGAGDYDMWCGLLERNIFIYPVNICLGYYYRWHEGQCTWKVHAQKQEMDYDKMIQDYWKNKWTS